MSYKYRGPNCDCCGNCVVAEDDFDRADDTSLGANWVELAGDAAIAGNRLALPSIGTIVRGVKPASGYFLKIADATAGAELLFGFADATTLDPAYTLTIGASDSTLSVNGRTVTVPVAAGEVFTVVICSRQCSTIRFYDAANELIFTYGVWGAGVISPGGAYPSFGTGAAGGVEFDDFQSFTSTGTVECPRCLECFICPDTDQICINVSGAVDALLWGHPPGTAAPFNAEHVATGIVRCVGVGTQCGWLKIISEADQTSVGAALVWTGSFWRLNVGLSRGTSTAVFQVDLDADDPDCETWDGLELTLVGASDSGIAAMFAAATVTVTAGTLCGAYDAEPKCCEERPSELYVTLILNGSPVYEDEPIPLVAEDPLTYDYFTANLAGMGSAEIVCVENNSGTPYFSHPGAGIEGAPLLTIESCDPFLATWTGVDGGDTYEVTITE